MQAIGEGETRSNNHAHRGERVTARSAPPRPGLVALRRLRSAAESAREELARTAALLGAGDDRRARLDAAADRLTNSVLRPLDAVLDGRPRRRQGAPDRAPTLWELARMATATRIEPGASPELLEATAALQDLACEFAATDRSPGTEDALAELTDLQGQLESEIQPAPNGPYLVTNARALRDWLGRELPVRPQMALCRCGASAIKPYCDGSHARIGFSDAKSPDRVPDQRDTYVGLQVTVYDNRGICQHSGLCTDRLATAFRVDQEPFVSPSAGRMDEIIRAVRDCPSGALSYAVDSIEAREQVDWHGQREPAIEVTKDGPYRITGGLPLRDPRGDDVPRAEGSSREHYALCRCGQSQNKPFCSGMHWYVDFRDPVPDHDATPTVFEWVGGLPALTRMTRLFYEKHIPHDPLLAKLFGEMAADHPQRVAAWLAEVFGGPKFYSGKYGGYERMLSQHIGKQITEEHRTRWVAALLEAAREAGVPNDPEFRSTFQSYIEWGSRLAVENSQTQSRPPPHMPMPHWEWNTASGPPGGRVSALAAPEQEPEEQVVLPRADEPVSFETHVKTLFRSQDRKSMQFAFDLWFYDDVRDNAEAILKRVKAGTMPCDGAWPAEWVEAFERWTQQGLAA
jgi:CDGSH-type Zn-finger protein/truncated hemoglobin YjbI